LGGIKKKVDKGRYPLSLGKEYIKQQTGKWRK
jgi:hypothetical protein